MTLDRHSPTAHAAYHDLLRLLLDDKVSDLRGTPTRVERGGRAYWYDTYRVGTDVRKTYIGEETDALLARLDRHQALRAEAEARASERARLVRILRAERFMGMDAATGSLLAAMAKAGVFRLGGTVVGTHAFRLYEGELGLRYRFDDLAQTGDVDIASFERLSLALDDRAEPPVEQVLSDFAFDPVPALDNAPAWRWRQSKGAALVEFLTPAFGEEGVRPLAALGVSAQALHHLNYLIADPIPAAVIYRSGVLVQIPRPERFAIHKLIVADRRSARDRIKAEKDRRQARFLIEVLLEDRPEDLLEAYHDALSRGPKWRERIEASLRIMPDIAGKLV
ncbi:GSU2403 family nucleotidyltransferase fold protein [Phaeovulum sp. NW3]|uniref:nucleotidyltransferase family protein n=1 Tax=Phaeovulum sp. NW3 TaxID=2934933 RepID=UPI002022642D|nr:GSU2403 family nucleotidyltransferase fold protein [Phaeovulum sp. NW3]MCL7466846.1 GSU2403 family nucleotidyltransferase fold protein [Phaeovulum sp. NW3]